MDIFPLLCAVSVAFTGLTRGAGVLPDALNKAVGETVMFTTTVTPPETPFLIVHWKFGDKNIILFNVNTNITTPEYEGRISLFLSTGSLQLRHLTLNDSGEYRITIVPPGEGATNGRTRLDVHELVSSVTATPSSTDLEQDSSVRLSCSSSGSSLSFLWLNGSSEVTASDRVQLTDGGSTLTMNVTRYDQGPFSCRVSNPVSQATSGPIHLSISYGPENMNLIISPSPEYYAEGSDISLSCSADSRPAAHFTWLLNGDLLPDTGPELRLINIQESQSGNYSCRAFNNKTLINKTSPSSVVSILELVSNVTATPSSTDLEQDSSVRLSCSSSGSSLSFLWLNGSSEVTASDRVQLTDGGSTLTMNVTRYDQGPFSCRVSNPLSQATSGPIHLSISYGPENMNLIISPSPEYYAEGSDISLSCSADSRPAAHFTWLLNGDLLPDTGPELRLINIQESQSGNYSCRAFNSKTLINKTSPPSVVSILENISGVSITSKTNQLIEGTSFNLSCDAAGSVFNREWRKGDLELTPDDNMALYDMNRVLSFHSLSKNDTGDYFCKVSNPLSQDEAKYSVVVSYGPENVQIEGPSTIKLTETLILTCSADSVPAAYTWMLNGTKMHNSSVFTKDNVDPSHSGNYTCEVRNNITGRTSSATRRVSVTDIPDTCLDGCIAGIVIGVLVVCGGLCGGGYYLYRTKKQTHKPADRNAPTGTGAEGQDNNAFAGNQEVKYADISIFRKTNGGTVQILPQSNASEYSEIRVNNNPPRPSSPPSYDAHEQRMKNPAPQPPLDLYAQVHKK